MERQQINLQERNIQAAPVLNIEEQNIQIAREQNLRAAPIRNMQEQNIQAAPIQNMQEINEHLNEAAQAIEWENNHAQLPPQAAPQPPMAQEVAAMSKREKKLLKQRQQEELQRQQQEEQQRQEEARRQAEEVRRRQQEEEARIRREAREARLRREEEERQEKRKLLFEDDTTLHAMEVMAQEADEIILQEKMQQFLWTAAERLLELRPELKDDYRRTVDYVPIAESLKLIAAEHAVTEEQMELVEKANQQMQAFEKLNRENVLMRIIDFELADIFKEEYQVFSGLKKAGNAIMEKYQEKDQRQMSELEDLGQEFAKVFRIKGENGQEINVLGKGSPFAYLGKKENLEKYHAQVQRVMEQRHCTKEEAEEQVVRERRSALQERALEKTVQGSVVKNVSVEEWKRNGGASFHHTLPAGEALQVVEESHGYLYAEDVGDGLMELHHTIPEKIELNINGEKKEYLLRRNYNLLMKCIAAQMIDENGNMYQDKVHKKQMDELQYQLSRAASKNKMDSDFQKAIKKSMEVLFENEEEAVAEAEQMCDFLRDMTAASKTGNFILKLEIITNWGRFMDMSGSAGDISYDVHIERLRKEWLADPDRRETEEEVEAILKQIPNVSLTEQRERLIEVMRQEEYEQDVIDKYVSALVSFHADMDAAAMELLDIRNMDIHSKDVPLSNACSANAYFYDNLSQLTGNAMGIMLYETKSHVEEYPREELAYILANTQKFSKFEENEEKLRTIEEHCFDVEYELTKEEKEIILDTAFEAYKYNYHQAAQIGESSNGIVTTCETFAAETTQAMVSPFIRKSAVGRYKGRTQQMDNEMTNIIESSQGSKIKISEGMKHYYNHDDPLPPLNDLRPELKEVFLNQGLPGAKNYVGR